MRKTIIILLVLLAGNVLAQAVDVAVSGDGSAEEIAREILAAQGDPATLRLIYEDGQIAEVTGYKADADSFLQGGIDEFEYFLTLEAEPITRGPALVPGICEPSKKETCESSPECVCYPSQVCDPGHASADLRGCVETTPPRNAHLEGTEYVCDVGYVWDSGMADCIPPKTCPPGAILFEGGCICSQGMELVDGECVAEGSSGGFFLVLVGLLVLALPFLGMGALLLLAALVFVLARKKK